MATPAKRRRIESSNADFRPTVCTRRSTIGHGNTSENSHSAAGYLGVPFDVLLLIFAFITSPMDKKAVLLTCKDWYAAMSHPSLWRNSCIVIRKASSPLRLWRLLEARQIRSVCVRTNSSFERSWHATLRKLERVAPCSVTHLMVYEFPIDFRFEKLSGAFMQLPHLQSLSLQLNGSYQLRGLKAHHFANIVELNLSHSGYSSINNTLDFVVLCDAVGSKLQRLSLNHFQLVGSIGNRDQAVIEIDCLPALNSLELTDCWSCVDGPIVTKITDKKNTKYSPEFCLRELRITRTTHRYPPNEELSLPAISEEVMSQLTVLEVSNFRLSDADIKKLCTNWCGFASCLQELNLSRNCLSGCGIDDLFRNTPKLKSVNFNSNKIGASMLRSDSFSCLPLECLMLADSECAHACLPVAELPDLFPKLVTLDLSCWSGLNDDTLSSLVKLDGLRTLVAKNTTLTSRVVEEFRVRMKNKPRVLCGWEQRLNHYEQYSDISDSSDEDDWYFGGANFHDDWGYGWDDSDSSSDGVAHECVLQ